MSKKHRATYAAILAKPNRSDIRWDDWITLLIVLGANIKNTSGSAVGVRLNGIYAVFHKPHPGSYIYPSDLKRMRKFLQEAGIQHVE